MNSAVAPEFDGPVRESQPTMAPRDDIDHRSARRLRRQQGRRRTRAARQRASGHGAAAVQGARRRGGQARRMGVRQAGARPAPVVLLSRRGRGVDQTSAAANIAALIEIVADDPGPRILNSADPDAPSALEISRIVAATSRPPVAGGPSRRARAGGARPPSLGPGAGDPAGHERGRAARLPAGRRLRRHRDRRAGLAGPSRRPAAAGFDHDYFAPMLDYAAEDAYLAALP